MSMFPVFKITKMLRYQKNDITDFIFLGQQYQANKILEAFSVVSWTAFPLSVSVVNLFFFS